MVLNKKDEASMAKYREYQRIYQQKYGRHYYKPEQKKKYQLYRKYAEIFRNILLD